MPVSLTMSAAAAPTVAPTPIICNFNLDGKCTFKKCHNSHDTEVIYTTLAAIYNTEDTWKPCPHYANQGRCKLGAMCKLAHNLELKSKVAHCADFIHSCADTIRNYSLVLDQLEVDHPELWSQLVGAFAILRDNYLQTENSQLKWWTNMCCGNLYLWDYVDLFEKYLPPVQDEPVQDVPLTAQEEIEAQGDVEDLYEACQQEEDELCAAQQHARYQAEKAAAEVFLVETECDDC